jgi:hypothetical protein
MRRTVDSFTYATAHYQAAQRTCQRAGQAFETTGHSLFLGNVINTALRALGAIALVGGLIILFAVFS